MIGIHRIGYGYHHFGDVLVGALSGLIIGYVSYRSFNLARKYCIADETNKTTENLETITWKYRIIQGVFIIICVLAIYDFFAHKFVKLAELKH